MAEGLRSLLLFSAACAAVLMAALHFSNVPFDPRYAVLLVYFIIVTAVLLTWQAKSAGRTNVFIRRFMAGLTIKLMSSLILLAILVRTAPDALTVPLAVIFAGLYIAFLAFSVVRSMNAVRGTKP